MAHNCMFVTVMKTEPLAYLLYLIYFRSKHCEKVISWSHLGLYAEDSSFVDAELPNQTAAVTRTFAFAICYMILNTLVILAAIACICKIFDWKIFE